MQRLGEIFPGDWPRMKYYLWLSVISTAMENLKKIYLGLRNKLCFFFFFFNGGAIDALCLSLCLASGGLWGTCFLRVMGGACVENVRKRVPASHQHLPQCWAGKNVFLSSVLLNLWRCWYRLPEEPIFPSDWPQSFTSLHYLSQNKQDFFIISLEGLL